MSLRTVSLRRLSLGRVFLRRALLLLALATLPGPLLLPSPALAAPAAVVPVLVVDAGVWGRLAEVHTLEAHFEQVQTRAILKAPLKSTGTVRFERPDQLTWSVEAPGRSTFSLHGNIAEMAYPELGMKERIDLAAVPEAGRLTTSLLVWMKADAAAVERDFVVTYRPDGAKLVPRDPKLLGLLSAIDLTILPDPWRVSTVALLEPDGDSVKISFSGVRLDGEAVADP